MLTEHDVPIIGSDYRQNHYIYRCPSADRGDACGVDGLSFDCSHDECHHPLTTKQADAIVAGLNLLDAVRTASTLAKATEDGQ